MTTESIKKNFKYNIDYILNHKLSDRKIADAHIELKGLDEIFVQYPQWKDYYGSNYGRCISLKCGKVTLLEETPDLNGYIVYKFTKPRRTYNGKKVDEAPKPLPITAQRLVADLFLPNFWNMDRNSLQTHHLNHNKTDNYYKNLLLVPASLHNVMNRVQKVVLFKNKTFRMVTPLDIFEITGLSLEEIINCTKGKPVQSDGKYSVFEVKGSLIGFQFYPKKKK